MHAFQLNSSHLNSHIHLDPRLSPPPSPLEGARTRPAPKPPLVPTLFVTLATERKPRKLGAGRGEHAFTTIWKKNTMWKNTNRFNMPNRSIENQTQNVNPARSRRTRLRRALSHGHHRTAMGWRPAMSKMKQHERTHKVCDGQKSQSIFPPSPLEGDKTDTDTKNHKRQTHRHVGASNVERR